MNDFDREQPAGGTAETDPLIGLSGEERLAYAVHRVEAKLLDYDGYDFSRRQILALNIFFELAQELRGREMFYAICMAIPRALFGLESTLYILEDEETFSLAACSTGRCDLASTRPWGEEMNQRLTVQGEELYIPIPGNPEYADMLAFVPPHNILGSFVIRPCADMPGHARLFLEKYVNRVGYQLHHRIIRARNREHIAFIKSMVQDIGHNVIVPNMYFKLYFNRLKRKIEELHLTTGRVLEMLRQCEGEDYVREGNRLAEIAGGIEAQYQEIYSHYESTSMFLETLLRRRHFEEGRYVLDKRDVNLRTTVIDPALERFRLRFEERGIEVEVDGEGDEEQVIRVILDRGLISQVLENLLSNALKYTEKVVRDGRKGRFVFCGWKILNDYFGPGKPGIRIWVTSSGNPLDLDDPMEVFKPGFRATNVARESGTGRGLYFVRQVVELHGGKVGYSHAANGNEFYLVLPYEHA
ncbi:sensor histidine kinase [Pseudodesulfovibrio indicus]|jgi:signal transduction histidine kinase|uniref:histidine kinase n=1 Tax=Pseudodesulfovibrio indicus TaxID=1716143 RepID=A0A126QKV8_9BACT|nr:HAMP domain-containing sensor histidine kinase [Pseudodesulfovibrio indicus]AMK10447.1 ATPase [Pseudodesulfovibrio indicus]TDT89157.1 histidine kinase/DNA gyrase B/HSP90-like ATPase [Pseudodesulfovibrio indicus]